MGIKEPERDPIAFTNCPYDKFLEYFPSGETSHIIGFPATCSMVAPVPRNSKPPSIKTNDE